MSAVVDRSLVEDVLARGVADWVYPAEIVGVARRSGLTDPAALRQLSIGLIAELLVRGLVVAGEYDGESHRPWDCSVAAAIVRIAEDWQAWGDEVPTPGAIVWLDVTPAGEAIGQAVLARERHTE